MRSPNRRVCPRNSNRNLFFVKPTVLPRRFVLDWFLWQSLVFSLLLLQAPLEQMLQSLLTLNGKDIKIPDAIDSLE